MINPFSITFGVLLGVLVWWSLGIWYVKLAEVVDTFAAVQ